MDRIKEEKQFWNKFAEEAKVEELIADTPASAALDFIWRFAPKAPKKVLEIGSGTGRLTIPVAREFKTAEVVGIDISPKMVAIAKKNAKKIKNVKFAASDGRTLPKGKFDLVYAFTVFQHIDAEGVEKYISEVAEHLEDKGVFVFQYVEGDENSAFSQQYPPEAISAWCANAQLEITDMISCKDLPNLHASWNFIVAKKYGTN